MENASVTISLGEILWILGFIAAAISTWYALKKIPFFSHEKRIHRLEEMAEENAELVTLIGKGVKCLLTNARTGNCIDKIKTAEEEMEKFLFDNRGAK